MSKEYINSGRKNQKQETRNKILSSAHYFLQSDKEFNLEDITESEDIANELIEKGGKQQVPYLVDEKNGVAMYESSDIIDYIRENKAEFTGGEAAPAAEAKPRVHISSAVCESCEG